jgi:drug/metabolite transporter (DMT)-like permease
MSSQSNGESETHTVQLDNETPDFKSIVAFGLAVLLGGGASVAIRYTYTELPPFWAAFMRFFSAAIIFWLLMLIRKVAVPRGRALLGAALFGILAVGASFALISFGLVETPASVSQTVTALVPLLTLIFATLHSQEQFTGRGVLGGVLAVAGILVVFGGSVSAGIQLSIPHVIAILIGTAFIAEAGVVLKIFPRSHPYATNAVAMSVGALILFVLSTVSGEPRMLPTSIGVWLALGYLVVGVSVGVFLLYIYILGRWTASATSYVFVLFPFVTVILATQLADEQISLAFIGGGILVLLGVWFGALMKPKPKPVEKPVRGEPAAENISDVAGCGMT